MSMTFSSGFKAFRFLLIVLTTAVVGYIGTIYWLKTSRTGSFLIEFLPLILIPVVVGILWRGKKITTNTAAAIIVGELLSIILIVATVVYIFGVLL